MIKRRFELREQAFAACQTALRGIGAMLDPAADRGPYNRAGIS